MTLIMMLLTLQIKYIGKHGIHMKKLAKLLNLNRNLQSLEEPSKSKPTFYVFRLWALLTKKLQPHFLKFWKPTLEELLVCGEKELSLPLSKIVLISG
jgi:hypothetical protein